MKANLRLSGIALQSAFQLSTGFDGDLFVDDSSVHDGIRCEVNVPRRDRPGDRSKHDDVVSDDGTFNTT